MRKKYTKKKSATIPMYKDGGQTKQEWISNKISELSKEGGRSHEQIIAIALNMANEKFQEGGQKKTLAELQNLRLNPTLPPTTDTPLTFEEEQKTIAPQKPVDRILYNVQTSENKQGLPEGNYTRVDYKDKTSDYLTPEGYENFRRMNNYRLYQEAQAKKLNQNPQLPPQYQKGGQTNPQLPPPKYGVESMYPIVYMDKATKQGEDGIYEGYNAYYRNPSSPDFNPDSDVVFYTKDEFELKKSLKQPTSQAAGQYDPEINKYLAKTKGRVGQLVQYQDGGNVLVSAPMDTRQRVWNPTNQMYQPSPTYSMQSAGNTPFGLSPSQWTPGTLPQTNFGQATTNPQDITTSDQIVAQPTNGVAYPAPTFSRANPEDINVEIDGQQPYVPTQEDVIKQNVEATEGTPIQPTAPVNQQPLGTTSPNNQPFQFFNPYGGVDLETSASVLGQGIANKDPLSIVGGALKLTTGLGRNIMGGLGAQRMQNQIMKNYAEQQRDVVTQANRPRTLTNQGNQIGLYQEGGEVQGSQEEQIFMQVADMLQQGVTPEEIMGQLLQNGLSEQEATQILQMVIQELQAQVPPQEQAPQEQQIMQNGGEILSSLRGKKIKDYTYNKDKDTYTISYEE